MTLLDIRNLSVTFETRTGPFRAVEGLDLSVAPQEVVAIVGESGSGKSVAMLAVMGLLPDSATVTADRLEFEGRELLGMGDRERRQIIGKDIAMIFQEPMASLNPCFTVGFQIKEMLRRHTDLDRDARQKRAVELLGMVGISEPERRLRAFPHQLSGGMSQRVMIAMATSCNPKLLIADEPTTALDVTIQAQILELLGDLQRNEGMALVLITHDMGVVAETAERVVVQYAGLQVERQPVRDLFRTHTILIPRLCLRPCRTAPRALACRRFRAWCRGRATAPPAASSTRAAPMPTTSAAPSTRRASPRRWALRSATIRSTSRPR